MERFLRAKHWQLFILQVGIPILLQIIMMVTFSVTIIANHDLHSNEPPENLFRTMMIFLPIIMVVAIGSLFAWQWSVGVGLQKKLPEGVTMRVGVFKTFLIIPLCYFALVISLMLYLFNSISTAPGEPPFMPGPGFFICIALFIPLHLFSIFCLFYNMVFVAKTIKTVELQREVTFSDYALEFVLTWFLPVGIWFLQPRINKIVQNGPTTF